MAENDNDNAAEQVATPTEEVAPVVMSEPTTAQQSSAPTPDSVQAQVTDSAPVAQEPAATPFAQSAEAADAFAAQGSDDQAPRDDPEAVTWTASEFINHQKGGGWYMILVAVTIVITGIVYLLTKDKITAAVVIVAALALAVYSRRQPRELNYQISADGVKVGDKHFSYESFKSFSIVPEAGFSSIVFMPMKRFAFPLTLYHAPEHAEGITAILTARLPLQNHEPDSIDRLMRRIRF